MRSIHQIRLGQAKAGGWDPVSKVKTKERGVQTVVSNRVDNQREYETYSYLYDKDTEMMRGEKEAMLKYMRREVVQNQEFLDRIRELEAENEYVVSENIGFRREIEKARGVIEQMKAEMERSSEGSVEELEETPTMRGRVT